MLDMLTPLSSKFILVLIDSTKMAELGMEITKMSMFSLERDLSQQIKTKLINIKNTQFKILKEMINSIQMKFQIKMNLMIMMTLMKMTMSLEENQIKDKNNPK